jgi:hypothetical protein
MKDLLQHQRLIKHHRFMKKIIKSASFLAILGSSAMSAGAATIISSDPAPTYDITGRVRNGNTGFEAVLFTPANPSPAGVPLNPVGAPIWNTNGNTYGQTYFSFQLTYTASTGTATWGIDFNHDGDFADSQELANSTTASLAGKSFEYVDLWMTGNNTFGANLNDFTINGVNFGSYSNTSTTALDQLFEDSTGLFGDITATGSFTFTGNGGSENPRIWVRLGSAKDLPPSNVPDGGTTLILLGGALTGLGALRRKFRASPGSVPAAKQIRHC